MSLNNITLSPLLLADLYHDVLIEPNATGVPEKPSQNYIGNNQKNILIVVSKNDTETINEHELNFLANVLAACKLSLAEVAIVKWPMVETNLTELLETLESKTVLLFNIDPISFGLPINFPSFQIQPHNKKVYMNAPSLLEIENNIDLKKRLWASLKILFSV
jgi:hypothetical protein